MSESGPRFYGRRRGKKLRPGRQALIDDLLPTLRVPLSGGAEAALDPKTLFDPRPEAVWLEIGFGGGEHLVHQAQSNPDTGIIGAEPYINGVAMLLGKIRRAGVQNLLQEIDN